MKKHILLILSCVALCLTSCSTVRKTAATASIDPIVVQYPTVVDLDINPVKKEKTYEWNWSLLRSDPPASIIKGNLTAEILKENDGDALLEPQYIIKKTMFGKRSITVIGFVAKFKNFRRALEEDLKALEATKTLPEAQQTIRTVNTPTGKSSKSNKNSKSSKSKSKKKR